MSNNNNNFIEILYKMNITLKFIIVIIVVVKGGVLNTFYFLFFQLKINYYKNNFVCAFVFFLHVLLREKEKKEILLNYYLKKIKF